MFKNFNDKGLILIKKFIVVILLIIIFSLIFYNYYGNKSNWNINESNLDINCEDDHVSLSDMFYFTTVTSFTIGYGDITPKTNSVKYLVMLKIFLTSGILLL
jgi:voltage-gated potassium channel